MRPIVKTVGPLAAAVANTIAQAQTLAAAGPLALNGASVVTTAPSFNGFARVPSASVAVLDKPRRIAITSSGNDAAVIFTVTGTNWTGQAITENIPGANAASAPSALDYATVTSISASGTTSSVTVGTTSTASTEWFRLSEWGSPKVAIQADVIGTVNYTIQTTLDDPNDPVTPTPASLVNWINSPDTNAVGQTASIQTAYENPPVWMRGVLNSGTGAVVITMTQAGGVLS